MAFASYGTLDFEFGLHDLPILILWPIHRISIGIQSINKNLGTLPQKLFLFLQLL
jgi:hypothetical protein